EYSKIVALLVYLCGEKDTAFVDNEAECYKGEDSIKATIFQDNKMIPSIQRPLSKLGSSSIESNFSINSETVWLFASKQNSHFGQTGRSPPNQMPTQLVPSFMEINFSKCSRVFLMKG
ncbi:unnamed protein product, partial [Larinioides sclopetarius]